MVVFSVLAQAFDQNFDLRAFFWLFAIIFLIIQEMSWAFYDSWYFFTIEIIVQWVADTLLFRTRQKNVKKLWKTAFLTRIFGRDRQKKDFSLENFWILLLP